MHVLITGISSGIGAELAREYLDRGDTVFGISRNPNRELENRERFYYLQQDLAEFENLRYYVYLFLEGIHTLDLVILNAGILPEIKDMRDTSLNEIQDVMKVNVWANKILLDVLTESVGVIHQVVAISSGAARSGSRGWNAYSLSKATLNMLIELYSQEMEQTKLYAIAPGIIDTNMQEHIAGISREEADKFPVIQRLQSMKGTADMPPAKEVAAMLADTFEKALEYESGSFLDVRDM